MAPAYSRVLPRVRGETCDTCQCDKTCIVCKCCSYTWIVPISVTTDKDSFDNFTEGWLNFSTGHWLNTIAQSVKYIDESCETIVKGKVTDSVSVRDQKEDVYSHLDLEFARILIANSNYTENVRRFGPIFRK